MNKHPHFPKPALAPKTPYKEPMPVGFQCPPSDAGLLPAQKLMRFVGPGPIAETDFWSYAKNGQPCPPGKESEWVACSFFLPSIAPETLSDLRKYPNLQDKTELAYVNVDQNSGPAKIKKNKHVSVWFFESYYPEESVSHLIPVDEYEPG